MSGENNCSQLTQDEARFILNALTQLSFTVKLGAELDAIALMAKSVIDKLTVKINALGDTPCPPPPIPPQ